MYPFNDFELRAVIANQHKKLSEWIEKYTNDEIMANDLDLLADNCYEKFYIEPVVIGEEEFKKRSIEQSKIRQERDRIFRNMDGQDFVDVDGITMRFYFGYTGDEKLFKCRASSWLLSYPKIILSNGYIVFEYSMPLQKTQKSDYIESQQLQLQCDLKKIQDGIDCVNADVSQYNGRLCGMALRELEERKKKVEQFYELSKAFEIPLKKNECAKTRIPTERKVLPMAKKYNNEPSYYISDGEYNDIMHVIKHNCSTYEKTPNTFRFIRGRKFA